MTDKLKPCPFCGGEARVREAGYRKWDGSHRRFYIAECECCTANIEDDEKEEVIKAWNTRKPMDRIVEQLENASCYIEDGDGHAGHVVFTDKAIAIVKGGKG